MRNKFIRYKGRVYVATRQLIDDACAQLREMWGAEKYDAWARKWAGRGNLEHRCYRVLLREQFDVVKREVQRKDLSKAIDHLDHIKHNHPIPGEEDLLNIEEWEHAIEKLDKKLRGRRKR